MRPLSTHSSIGFLALSLLTLIACSAQRGDEPARSESRLDSTVDVLTQHNDTQRTGVNANETTLSPQVVAGGGFGRLFTRNVDGAIFAQPLYVAGAIGGKNIVIVSTEHNSVYAFDADAATASAPIWTVNLGPSFPAADAQCGLLTPEIGITSTPIIDKASGTIWVSAKTKRGAHAALELHALDLATGQEKRNSPVEITATAPGTGDGSVGGQLQLDPVKHLNRPGLLKVGNTIALGFASQCDVDPYHGWIVTYDATTLAQTGVHVDTPDGSEGGIWQGAVGLASDATGDIFYASGNGTFDGARNLGNSMVRLHPTANGLSVSSFFTPADSNALNQHDLDLGSTGILLVPGTNLAVSGNKAGTFYVTDRGQMGGISAADRGIVQKFQATSHGAFGGPAFYANRLFVWGTGDVLKSFTFDGNAFSDVPAQQGTRTTGYPGGQMSISANGTSDLGTAILWTVRSARTAAGLAGSPGPGILEAYAAADIQQRLWTSDTSEDALGDIAKFAAPTIANGKVYVGTESKELVVYGLRSGAEPDGGTDAGPANDASATDAGPDEASDPQAAPTFTQVYTGLFGPGTPGHCTNCHAHGHGGFQCSNKSDCYDSLVANGLISPGANAGDSVLGKQGSSPLAWFGGPMPLDNPVQNPAATATITTWLAAGAQNN